MNFSAITALAGACLFSGAALADPWSVPASWEVEQREICFENAGIELVGTLHAIAGAKSAPAVVVTHGAGPGERDTLLYQQIADYFPAIGYSVFVYDRRGSGDSGGERAGASYRDLARDAVAAKRAIAEDDAVDSESIGFWGLSQGGWVVMEAATMSEPAFAISVSSPLTTPGRQMQVLAYHYVLIGGHGEAAARQAKEARQTLDDYFRGDVEFEAAQAAFAEIENEPWYGHTHLPPASELPANVEDSTWNLEMDYDPTIAFEAVDTPLLFILGGEDFDIPVAETLDILEDLPPAENREVVVVPDADHVLRVREEADISSELVSDANIYFLVMGHWLSRVQL